MESNRRKSEPRVTFIALRQSLVALAVQAALQAPAYALPQGPNIVAGQVAISQPAAGRMNVTASNGAIINWNKFSIGAGETTRFIQPSASSAVLNRVVGGNVSQLLGQLQANGRVFLINSNGIVIGNGARIDTNGFLASTLDITDSDFLAGKLRFFATPESGSIVNRGTIVTSAGGQVILLAPNIENSGLIETPGGELLLAAGRKIELANPHLDSVTFEVQAPTDSVLNLGKLIADNGAISVFAGTLKNGGEVRANRIAQGADGSVYLSASSELELQAGGSVRSDGFAGGSIRIDSAAGTARIAGAISARGDDGKGGDILVTGNRIALESGALVDVSGAKGGGQIRVGGDFQGRNPDVVNAERVFVDANAQLNADAGQQGDGGRIIIWSDDMTRYYGALSTQGGRQSGNGGFAEVSGKQNLEFFGTANLGAPQGTQGTLLLDPLDLIVANSGGYLPSVVDQFADFPDNLVTISPTALNSIHGNVTLQANRHIYFNDAVALTTSGAGLTAQAGGVNGTDGNIYLNQGITTTGGAVSLSGNTISGTGGITTQGGSVSLTTASSLSGYYGPISTAGGNVAATAGGSINNTNINAGSGNIQVGTTAGSLYNNTLTGGTVSLNASSSIYGTVNAANRIDATSSGSSIQLYNASGQPLRIGTLQAASDVYLYGYAGIQQVAGGGTTAPRVRVYANSNPSTTGSAAAPLILATPQLYLNNLATPAYVGFSGSPTLTALSLSGTLAGLGGTSITGAANLSTFNLANSGGLLQANAIATGGLGSGFALNVSDAGMNVPTLTMPGAGVTLTAAGAMSIGTLSSGSLTANAKGGISATSITTNAGSINLTANKCNYSYPYPLCTDTSPVTLGTLTASGSIYVNALDNGAVSIGSLSAGSGVSVTAGNNYYSYTDYDYHYTANSLSIGSLTAGSSTYLYVDGIGNLTTSGNLATTAGSLYLSTQDGSITTGGSVSAASSLSMSANNGSILATAGALAAGSGAEVGVQYEGVNVGSVTIGSLTTTNGNASLYAPQSVTFQSVTAGGSSRDVSMFSKLEGIYASTDSAAVDISAGRNVTLTASNTTNGRIGNNAFANPLDIAAGVSNTTAAVNMTAGMNIGTTGNPVRVDYGSTASTLKVAAGQQFHVTTPDALRSIELTISAAGVGAGGTATLDSADLDITASSDGTTLTLGNITQTNPLDKLALTASGSSNLMVGSVNLATTGFNGFEIAAAGGSVTSGNVTAGSIKVTGTSLTLGTVATTGTRHGSYSTPLDFLDLNASTGNVSATSLSSASKAVVQAGGDIAVAGAIQSTGTASYYGSTDFLSLDAGSAISAGSISSATYVDLSAGTNIAITGAILSPGTNGYDNSTISAIGNLNAASISSGNSLTVSGNSITTGGISATSRNLTIDGTTFNTGNLTASSLNLTATGSYVSGAITITAPTTTITAPGGINTDLTGTTSLTLQTGGLFDVSSTVALTSLNVTADGSVAAAGSSVTASGQSLTLSGGNTLSLSSASSLNTYYTDTSNIAALALSGSLSSGGLFQVSTPTANLTTSSVSGGNLSLTTGGTGGIALNGVNTNGGGVTLYTSGGSGGIALNSVSTGGGSVGANASAGDITVTSVTTTGGNVNLATTSGSIAATGAGTHMNTANSLGNPAGTVTLSAIGLGGNIGAGNTLNIDRTSTLNLTARNTIDTAVTGTLANLSVDTFGSGTGSVSITSPNHAGLSISRSGGNLALGALSPSSAGTFSLTARDGSLTVNGNLGNLTGLTLNAGNGYNATGDLIIAASGGLPRSVTATGNLNLRAGRDVLLSAGSGAGENLALQGAATTLQAGRDILLTANAGSAALMQTGGGTQSLQAGRDIKLTGGSLATGASVAVTSAGSQEFNAEGDFVLVAGSSDNAFARAQATSSQYLYTNNFSVSGGGNAAFAEMTGSYQDFQDIDGAALIQGGTGTGAYARVASTGSQYFGYTYTYYGNNPTDAITVSGGTGNGAYASLRANSSQTINGGGNISVLGGGSGAYAEIWSGGSQTVGDTASYYYDPTANIVVQGGTGANASASIRAASGQTIEAGNNISLTAGAATGAFAEIFNATSGTQTIGNYSSSYYDDATDAITLTAANASGAHAEIRNAGGNQNVYASQSITLTSGNADNADALLSASTSQTVATYANLVLTGGTAVTPGLNLTGLYAAGTNQNVSASGNISLTGGGAGADVTIRKTGTGTQTVNAGGTLVLSSLNAGAGAVSIETSGSSINQSLQIGGATSLINGGGQSVALSSSGDQIISTDSLSLAQTSAMTSALTQINASGDQTITLNGSGSVGSALLSLSNESSAAGSLTQILAGMDQTITMSTPYAGVFTLGSATSTGKSQVFAAGTQTTVVGSLLVQGGASASAMANLEADGDKSVSTLYGGIQVLGGAAGPAQIDPPNLNVVSNGAILVQGGSGSSAYALITGGNINIAATNGNVSLLGGGGSANITATGTPGTINIFGSGDLTITPGSGGVSIITLSAPSTINILGACYGCETGLIGPFTLIVGSTGIVIVPGTPGAINPFDDVLSLVDYASGWNDLNDFYFIYDEDGNPVSFGRRVQQCS